MNKIFKIPVTWESYGIVEIEAETVEKAIEIFDRTEPEIELPTKWAYVDGSFDRYTEEEIKDLNETDKNEP